MAVARGTAILIVCASYLAITSCAPYKSRMADVSTTVPEAYAGAAGQEEAVSDMGRWWERFGDERLNGLVEEALRNNLDIAQAYERMNQALAVASATGSSRSPSLDLKAAGGRARQQFGFTGSNTYDSYSLSAAARYEIDLWQKLASREQADNLSALASREDMKALYIGISAQVAELHYLALEQRAQLQLTERTIEAFEDSLERVERRYRAGLVSPLDVYQARQNLALARSQRPVFEANLATALNAIYALMGRFPGEDAGRIKGDMPEPPDFPLGIPSQLLSRRPDVRAALLRLEANDKRIGAAVADRFPSFSLIGEYGGASKELKSVLDSPNILWNLFLQAAQPVIDGGRRKAEVERTEAVFRESLAHYQQTVINAFTEVEDTLSEGRASEQRILMLRDRVAASEGEMRLSLERYLQGLSDYLPVLTAQQRMFDSESALLGARRQLLSDRIRLARALGGDWVEDELRRRMTVEKSGKEDER